MFVPDLIFSLFKSFSRYQFKIVYPDPLFYAKGVYVENLSEYFVKSPEEIDRLLKSGKKKLAIAETKMNRQSSRFVIERHFSQTQEAPCSHDLCKALLNLPPFHVSDSESRKDRSSGNNSGNGGGGSGRG